MSPTRSVPVPLCRFLLWRGTTVVFWGIVWAVATVTVVTAVPLVIGYGITGAAAAMVAGGLASFLVMTFVLARELRRVDAA